QSEHHHHQASLSLIIKFCLKLTLSPSWYIMNNTNGQMGVIEDISRSGDVSISDRYVYHSQNN
ncbi:hypothetical protein PJP07_31235, partial [Mycobacterium kansasii]